MGGLCWIEKGGRVEEVGDMILVEGREEEEEKNKKRWKEEQRCCAAAQLCSSHHLPLVVALVNWVLSSLQNK